MLPFFAAAAHAPFILLQKNALIALHGKLNKIAQAIACFLLPGDAPMLLNGLNMLKLLSVARVRTDSVLKRWNDHLGIRLPV